jgi:4-amino-4-deoxy-L-arabinose transferase-like glycosyltransferase
MKKYFKNISKIELICIFLIFTILIIKFLNIHPTFSDENIYFLVGKRIWKGEIPYKEFSFVHPPLQGYILAFLFKIFGISLTIAKLLPLISSTISTFLIFKICKKIFDERTAFFALIFFLLTPGFIAFSDQSLGMWEALMFILLSIYLLIENKIILSALSFSIALYIRYLSLAYFPLLLIYAYLKNKNWKKFLIFSISISFTLFTSFYLIFGYRFIEDTILFNFYAKLAFRKIPKLPFQYLNMGYFTIFLAIFSAFLAYFNKLKIALLFSIYPLLIDLSIFFVFTKIIYYYFLISTPFVVIATAKIFSSYKELIPRFFIFIVIFLAIWTNLNTFDFYLNPKNSDIFYSILEHVKTKASSQDKIFGRQSIVSFISFLTDIPVTSSVSPYISYSVYIKAEDVIAMLEKQKPKFIIDLNNVFISNPYFKNYLEENYILDATYSTEFLRYNLYLRKL